MIVNPTQAQITTIRRALGSNIKLSTRIAMVPWYEGASVAKRAVRVLQYRKAGGGVFDVPDRLLS